VGALALVVVYVATVVRGGRERLAAMSAKESRGKSEAEAKA
jgi:hypothetical protein